MLPLARWSVATPATDPNACVCFPICAPFKNGCHSCWVVRRGFLGSAVLRFRWLALSVGLVVVAAGCGSGPSIPEGIDCDALVFSSETDGDWDIYTLADGVLVEVTNGGGNVNPSWSPDGTQILFTSSRDGDPDLYVMSAEGTDVVRITDNDEFDSSSDWSPDGSTIIFDRVAGDTDFAQVFVAPFGIPIEGATQLTSGEPNAKPTWSPDGSHITFLSWRDGNAEIYIMTSEGADQVNVTEHPGKDVLPVWSYDGSQIAFASDRDGDSQIYVMGADGSNPTRITDHPTGATNPSWSADGRHVLFTSAGDEHVIYAVPATGGGEQRITEGFVHHCHS